MLSSEVLPAPFGPMMETMRPLGMSSDTSSTAVTPPKRLPTPATESWTAAALICWEAGVKFISPPLTSGRWADAHERHGASRPASTNPPRSHCSVRTARRSLLPVIGLRSSGCGAILEQAARPAKGCRSVCLRLRSEATGMPHASTCRFARPGRHLARACLPPVAVRCSSSSRDAGRRRPVAGKPYQDRWSPSPSSSLVLATLIDRSVIRLLHTQLW